MNTSYKFSIKVSAPFTKILGYAPAYNPSVSSYRSKPNHCSSHPPKNCQPFNINLSYLSKYHKFFKIYMRFTLISTYLTSLNIIKVSRYI